MKLLLLLFSLIHLSVAFKLLTKSQWFDIQYYIVAPDTTPSMMEKVRHILFHRYVPLAHSMTKNFRKFHRRKSQSISEGDMLFLAYKGLYDSVRNYNGKYSFTKYAKIYINGALYKSLTVHNPISKLSTNERRFRVTDKDSDYYELRKNIYLNTRDYLRSKLQPEPSDYHYSRKWKIINTFSPFVRRCFYYRFDFYFNTIRTNKNVGVLMCCSEELVRRNIANYITLLNQNYSYISFD